MAEKKECEKSQNIVDEASEKEKKERNNADGHVLAVSDYEPGSEYVYYWGAAWDKADIKTPEAWNEYMANYAQKVRNPLTVTIK